MVYTPHLIAQYETGLDNSLQPWLLPDESQEDLFDGFVYRGQWEKRQGYAYYATGTDADLPYSESRIVEQVAAVPMVGAIDSVNTTYTLVAQTPIRRGTFVVTGTVPAQVVTDDGVGGFTGDGTGTINYTTGAVSITFNAAPTAGTVTATYDIHPGLPVMMVANFYTASNTRELIVADTRNINRYNSSTDRLDDITGANTFTGTLNNFFSWLNYPNATDVNRLLFVNNIDPIKNYDGTTVANYAFTLAGVAVTAFTCLLMFQVKDRLILLRTTENGVTYPRRIRISGTGASCDIFDSTAIGAGLIEIPDDSWIMGACPNRDDLLIFTELSVWTLKYTGNDTTPFVLYRLDDTRGSNAPYAAITYLGRSSAVSRRGFIISDGYKVERQDDKIPQYSFNRINQNTDKFSLCFAGTVDEDRDHYLIHPSPSAATSDRILITNYEEDNYSVYRIGLSCMGSFIESFNTTWNTLLQYKTWDEMATKFGSWNAFTYSKGTPIAIGGGHRGEIWQLNLDELEDNPVHVYNITIINDDTIQVTTDWNNYVVGDYIYLENVQGLTNVNNRQFAITLVTDNYTFQLRTLESEPVVGAYTSLGKAARVIPFESKTKKFNPFVNAGLKVRCGWLYFYIDTSNTFLTEGDENTITPTPVQAKIVVEVITNDTQQATQITGFNISPYQPNASNLTFEVGTKKWNKIWINQTARFVQFRVKNTQAGAKIKIQAMMPGFAPGGILV